MNARIVSAVIACIVSLPSSIAAEPDPASINITTWNIQYGSDNGPDSNGWPKRKHALKAALEAQKPQILCVQEALAGQIDFLEKLLPEHGRIGVGRDDGKTAGEFCAIFFAKERFKLIDSGTFWLSETPEQPGKTWDDPYQRTCAWARLQDNVTKKSFRIFATHFPLKVNAREKATPVLLKKIAEIHPEEPVMLAGDFNCGPDSPTWRAIAESGLIDSAQHSAPTWHYGGLGLVCIDAIFCGKDWRAKSAEVIRFKGQGGYPSDHFGVQAVVELKEGGNATQEK